MERVKFSGVGNIIRFNWHFYVISLLGIISLLISANFLPDRIAFIIRVMAILISIAMFLSLLASAYIYDFSDLYSFNWLIKNGINPGKNLVNIHAGFDETSHLLTKIYPNSKLLVFDFYDPEKHTEVSIERARKAYPPFPNTVKITTINIPLAKKSVDTILLTLAAHEIRDRNERTVFLNTLSKTLTPEGKIVVTEHLRDVNNFFAFTIGFLHFFSRKAWLKNFKQAELKVLSEFKITPFLSVFILQPHGTSS